MSDDVHTVALELAGDAVDRAATLAAVRRRLFDAGAEGPALSRHVLLRRLGAGGSGVVYEAYDPELDRKVAIKLLQASSRRYDPEGDARLRREAQAIARVSHPNVIAVYDVGAYTEREVGGLLSSLRQRDDGTDIPDRGVFVVMELVDGPSLRGWLQSQPSRAEIMVVFGQAGRGLAAAHLEGLVHRDFKPDNVLVGPPSSPGGVPRVRVLDFGLARPVASRSSQSGEVSGELADDTSRAETLTRQGVVMGTPPYMSPEQHRGADADPRSDQYNFCVALWEALAGRRPFARGSSRELLAAKAKGPPPPPSKTATPERVWRALRRGLDPDPAQRFASMEALLAELERQPWAWLRWALPSTVALVGVSIGALGMTADDPDRCGEAARALDFGEPRRDALREHLLAFGSEAGPPAWAHVEPRLEEHAEQWRALSRQTCEALTSTSSEAPDKVEATASCLQRRHADFDITVSVLLTVEHREEAERVVAGLQSIEACRDPAASGEPLLPPPGPDRVEGLEILALVTRAETHDRAGQAGEAYAAGRDATEQARALGHPPTLARALTRLASLEWDRDRVEVARDLFEEAAVAAERAGDDYTALRAELALAGVLCKGLQRYDEALRLLDLVEARAEQRGVGDTLLAEVARYRGMALEYQGDFTAAEAELKRAVAEFERVAGDDALPVTSGLVPLSAVQLALGRPEAALQSLDRALAIRHGALGETTGDAMIHNNRGTVLWDLGRSTEACASYAKARGLFAQAYGETSSNVAMTDNNLGICASHRGDYEEALKIHRRSLAIKRQALGESHPDLGYSYANIGRMLLQLRDLDGADEAFEYAYARWSEGLAPEHPLLVEPLAGRAEVARQRGDAAEARRLYLEAQRLLGDSHDPELTDEVEFGLAATDPDPVAGATRMARLASAPTRAANPLLAARVRAWMAEQG